MTSQTRIGRDERGRTVCRPARFSHLRDALRSALTPNAASATKAGSGGLTTTAPDAYRTNATIQLSAADEARLRAQSDPRIVGQVHDEVLMTSDDRIATETESLNKIVREFIGKRQFDDLSTAEVAELTELLRGGVATARELAKHFDLKGVWIVEAFKRRLGLTKTRSVASNSHPVIDVDAELEALEKRRVELLAKKAEQEIKFEWAENSPLASHSAPGYTSHLDGVVIIHGVGARFRAAGGFAKFRAWVEKEVSQVGAPHREES